MNWRNIFMNYDCAIIGGGPAGLNAALVLGRAKRNVALLDNNSPRNAVTHASHGYLTRDGIEPGEFRRIAYEEVLRYPSVTHMDTKVITIEKAEHAFIIQTAAGEQIQARKIILAAGLKEEYPDIEGLHDFYGKSVFACPFCDGWELRDQPLAIVADVPGIFHRVKLLVNWSKDLIVCTNGGQNLSSEERNEMEARGIPIIDTPVASFSGDNGKLAKIHFVDGTHIERSGALISPALSSNAVFQEVLGYERNDLGGIVTNDMGKTTVAGVFAAGDSAYVMPSQLIIAAASGSKAAAAVVSELIEEDW